MGWTWTVREKETPLGRDFWEAAVDEVEGEALQDESSLLLLLLFEEVEEEQSSSREEPLGTRTKPGGRL